MTAEEKLKHDLTELQRLLVRLNNDRMARQFSIDELKADLRRAESSYAELARLAWKVLNSVDIMHNPPGMTSPTYSTVGQTEIANMRTFLTAHPPEKPCQK